MAATGITRVFPDLSDDLLLNLFYKGARAQWTSRDLDWSASPAMSERQKLALARLLTPVYFGEQTAMAGASSILPKVMAAGETTAQLYLASFIMDEARHFETLSRLYRALGHDPMGIREIPELLRYHHRIRQGDRADWVWGILFSDVIAKHFYRAFGMAQHDPLFLGLSTRILQDESRHLAFAEHYLRRNVAGMHPSRKRALVDMRDDLFRILEAMTERVRADAAAFEVDADEYLRWVWTDVDAFARRIGLFDHASDPPPPDEFGGSEDTPQGVGNETAEAIGDDTLRRGHADTDGAADDGAFQPRGRADTRGAGGAMHSAAGPLDQPAGVRDSVRGAAGEAPRRGEPPRERDDVARCFGCLLSLICGRRLAPA